jgi:hypothetical protein
MVPNKKQNSRIKSDGKTTLMNVIKLYMKDKVDKVIKGKFNNIFNSPKSKDSNVQKVQRKGYEMQRPVSNFRSGEKLPKVSSKFSSKTFLEKVAKTVSQSKFLRAKNLSYDDNAFNFTGPYLNTEFSTLPYELTKQLNTQTVTSVNSSKTMIIVNQTNLSSQPINDGDNQVVMGNNNVINIINNNQPSEVNNNIINIVNSERKSSDVLKLKMNVYDINVLVPNSENINEENEVISPKFDSVKNEKDNIAELNESKSKLKSFQTFNFVPKMQIDITRMPIAKTLSLRINNINHNINLPSDITKVIRTSDKSKSLSIISNENTNQTNDIVKKEDNKVTEDTFSPFRKSVIKSSSNVDSDLNTNTIFHKKVSIQLTPDMTQDILGRDIGMYRGFSMKWTDSSFELSKNPTEKFEAFDDSDDERYDFIKAKVNEILKRIKDNFEDDIPRRESKLHSNQFIRNVNRSNTMLMTLKLRAKELKDSIGRCCISKSVIVRRSDYLTLTKAEAKFKRSNSSKLTGGYQKSKINLQSEINKIAIADGQVVKQKFLELRRNMYLEFRLIAIANLKDEYITESKNSSQKFIRSLIKNEKLNRERLAKSKKIIDFYKTGMKRKVTDIIQPIKMLPTFSDDKPTNFEALQFTATDFIISKHLNNTYIDIYKELLLSIYNNFNNFKNELGEKVLNSNLFVNFKLGNDRRSSRLCTMKLRRSPTSKKESLMRIKKFNPFMGVRNDNYMNNFVQKDRTYNKDDEEYFLNYEQSSNEAEPVARLRSLTNVNFKSTEFDLLRSFKGSKAWRNPDEKNYQSSVDENCKEKKIKIKKRKLDPQKSLKKSRSKYKLNIDVKFNPDKPALTSETIKNIIGSRDHPL